jgi:hypothetical protein
MLHFLERAGMLTERKLRLFAAAAVRRIWPHLTDARSRRAVEVAERYADGLANVEELAAARFDAQAAEDGSPTAASTAAWLAAGRVYDSVRDAALEVLHALQECDRWRTEVVEEQRAQCRLVRELFGERLSPLGPVDPSLLSWNAGLVHHLAQAAYDERQLPEGTLDPAHLCILADALEEGGCVDAPLLEHLRSPGPHVRGCVALDAVLQRS